PTHSPKNDNTSEMTTFKCIHQTDLSNEIVNLAYRLLKLCNSARFSAEIGRCLCWTDFAIKA
ncbi:MAG: hypothetical protein KA732_13210, partial [Providencia sp.]|uniref:hypothetical protein n=1 Tax=Providencia sp. TaxID=589 RepID=UPI001B6E178F